MEHGEKREGGEGVEWGAVAPKSGWLQVRAHKNVIQTNFCYALICSASSYGQWQSYCIMLKKISIMIRTGDPIWTLPNRITAIRALAYGKTTKIAN